MRISQIISVIGAHLLLGRKVSFPCAIALGIPMPFVFVLILSADLIQIPFYCLVFSKLAEGVSIFKRIHDKVSTTKQNLAGNGFFNFLMKTGEIGVFATASLPGAGGVQGGMILAHILQMPKSKSVMIISIASFLGCAIFAFCGLTLCQILRIK